MIQSGGNVPNEGENPEQKGTTEPMSNLSEREVKEKTNLLRQRLDKNERELRSIFQEISLHNEGGQELKTKRDALNARVKELSLKALDLRKKRDEANARISELKSQRDNLRGKGKEFGEKIKELKKTRDDFNKTARGRIETLERAYSEELSTFLTADIPLEHEVNVFNRLIELGQRLDATRKADLIHAEISQEYHKTKDIYSSTDSLHEQIQTYAQESQRYHDDMITLYKEIDAIRKEADSYHFQLSEKYKCIDPLRKRIDALKIDSQKMRGELDIYLEQMKGIQLAKEERKNEEKREHARDKFQKSGRLSLDEFRILMENKDIEL